MNGKGAFATVDPPPCTPVVGTMNVDGLVVVVDPPSTKPDVVEVAVLVPMAPTVPVQKALNGQQATCPASSRAQFVLTGQQALL